MQDRHADLMKQGFMKPSKVKQAYSVGIDVCGYVNTDIGSKAEALKVAQHYVDSQRKDLPKVGGAYAREVGAAYIWVKDAHGNTIAAWSKVVHKWARVA